MNNGEEHEMSFSERHALLRLLIYSHHNNIAPGAHLKGRLLYTATELRKLADEADALSELLPQDNIKMCFCRKAPCECP